jgi:hypothetical protein
MTMDSDLLLTKADLDKFEARLNMRLVAVEERLNGRLVAIEAQLSQLTLLAQHQGKMIGELSSFVAQLLPTTRTRESGVPQGPPTPSPFTRQRGVSP